MRTTYSHVANVRVAENTYLTFSRRRYEKNAANDDEVKFKVFRKYTTVFFVLELANTRDDPNRRHSTIRIIQRIRMGVVF